jgi:hypothetical protein
MIWKKDMKHKLLKLLNTCDPSTAAISPRTEIYLWDNLCGKVNIPAETVLKIINNLQEDIPYGKNLINSRENRSF